MNTSTPTYKNHRFPPEIISHGVWLYFRFCLSYRDVEELLFARGIIVTYEAIRKWCQKFGQAYANQLRHRRASNRVTTLFTSVGNEADRVEST
jgi:putative transposase